MAGKEAALWFVLRRGRMLVYRGKRVDVPRAVAPEDLGLDVRFCQEIGTLDRWRCYAAELKPDTESPEEMVFRDLRSLLVDVDERFFAMVGRAKQIVEWHETHRFCGRCGGETVPVPTELEGLSAVRDALISTLEPRGDRACKARGQRPSGSFAGLPT